VPPANANRALLGRTLRSIRERKGLTQERVAFLAQIHPNYVSDTELGKRNISWDYLSRWVAALGLDWAAFGAELDKASRSRRAASSEAR
jgi:transcriptional regulator with XRE-family HTH domain